MSLSAPQAMALPPESRLGAVYPHPNLADAYSIELPPGTSSDPELLARFIFSRQPRWVAALMGLRDTIVTAFGLKTGRKLRADDRNGSRVGIFRLYQKSGTEVIVGEDDKHLDFRASVLYRPGGERAQPPSLVLSTVVECHNLLGRAYLTLIAPFHRLVVQSFLRQAAKAGWPLASEVRR